jgi:hypothetical protein
MGVHNNVHIPKGAWPNFTWYAIEFAIVLAVSMLLAREVNMYLSELTPEIQNYIWFAIVGIVFIAWYLGIRRLIFKKKVLQNSY